MGVSRCPGTGFGQVSDDDVDPPRRDQARDSGPYLACQLADRNAPPGAYGDHYMIPGHPHPGHLPARQVRHHAAPGTRAKIIDGRAAAGRSGNGVEVDAVDHPRRHLAFCREHGLGHDTREGASPSSSPLPAR